jgi:hypothetical protein
MFAKTKKLYNFKFQMANFLIKIFNDQGKWEKAETMKTHSHLCKSKYRIKNPLKIQRDDENPFCVIILAEKHYKTLVEKSF